MQAYEYDRTWANLFHSEPSMLVTMSLKVNQDHVYISFGRSPPTEAVLLRCTIKSSTRFYLIIFIFFYFALVAAFFFVLFYRTGLKMLRLQRATCIVSAGTIVRSSATLTNRRSREKLVDPTRGTVLSGGSTDLLRRRGPGSTKVLRVTNKAGRVFEVSVPISKITHPQKKLVSPLRNGEWAQLDTSYVDVGDFDDDVPTALGEAIQGGGAVEDLCEAFVAQCVEYMAMDTEGMVNQTQTMDLNSGPDYENEDRMSIRRRRWFTLVHQLDAVRCSLWPDEGLVHAMQGSITTLEAATMQYKALSAAAAASTFFIAKRQPYEDRPDSDYQPLQLERELVATCASIAAAGVMVFFANGSIGIQRLTTIASLCNHYSVPFSLCVTGTQDSSVAVLEVVDNIRSSLNRSDNSPSVPQKIAAGLLTVLTQSPLPLSDAADGSESSLRCFAALDFLFSCCTRVGQQDALSSLDGDDLVALLQAAVRIRIDNEALFQEHSAPYAAFVAEFRFHVSVTLNRCRALLYRRAGGTTVETEGGLLPIVELQQNADRRHADLTIHHKLGMTASQGHKEARLDLRHTARLLKAMRQLESLEELRNGADVTLVQDLNHHLSRCVTSSATGGKLFQLRDIIYALEAVGHNATHRKLWESNRVLAALDQLVGGLLHELSDVKTFAELVSGFAACDCVPSSLGRIYAVGLRLLATEARKTVPSKSALQHVAKICGAAALIYSGDMNSLGRSITPVSMFSLSPSPAGALPSTVAEKATAVFGTPLTSDDVETLVLFARSLFVTGHGDMGASMVQRHLQLLSSALENSEDVTVRCHIALLLAVSHQHVAKSDADETIVDQLASALHAAVTRHAPADVFSAEELFQLTALRVYALNELDHVDRSLFPPVTCSGDIADNVPLLSLSEIAFVYAHVDVLNSGHRGALLQALQSALHDGLATVQQRLSKTMDAQASRSISFTVASLDHVVRVRDSEPKWSEARWASLVALQTSPNEETLSTTAAKLLGRYMHLVAEVQRAPTPRKDNSFELSHVIRTQELTAMDADLEECAAVLESANKLRVAEEEFARADGTVAAL
jgi:hypothetical protein